MNNSETKLWKLFFEIEREIGGQEEENTALKEKIKQLEEQKITKSSSVWEHKDWVELESGKRFLTKKELSKYLGMAAGTISNQISIGTFPIRVKKMGTSVRFDMREILDYLETNKPFWERDKEQKEAKH